jgi:DNA-directed RNA polymerase sigma subunit (sigma70/sigma32)|tara:strand:+ start:769 stop:930 length:162 start_codon:yes stop_codon:yes gene_type:complete
MKELKSSSNSSRNAEIVKMIDENRMTMTAVAKWFSISKQRVKQIYDRDKAKNV